MIRGTVNARLEAVIRLRVRKLLGHSDVRTTMVYTHVLNKGGRGVKSPADFDDFVSA